MITYINGISSALTRAYMITYINGISSTSALRIISKQSVATGYSRRAAAQLQRELRLSSIRIQTVPSTTVYDVSISIMTSYSNEDIAHAFFGDISSAEAKIKIPCKGGCNKLITNNISIYTPLISHIETYYKDMKTL